MQDWFDDKTPKPFHDQIAPALKEVERLSPLLTGATWQHDGIALYYSHPSIQLGWILDAQAHWLKRYPAVQGVLFMVILASETLYGRFALFQRRASVPKSNPVAVEAVI